MHEPDSTASEHSATEAGTGSSPVAGSQSSAEFASRPSGVARPEHPRPDFGEEPTQQLPVVVPAAGPHAAVPPRAVGAPAGPARGALPVVSARRVGRGLILAAILAALVTGVLLGRTIAYQPSNDRPVAVAGPAQTTQPSDQALPVSGRRVTAPLGSTRTSRIEVTGVSTLLRIRTADLGDRLFRIATLDDSAVPRVVDTDHGPRLDLTRTRTPGTVGADIQLNSSVDWTIRLTGGSTEPVIDMRSGGLARIELVGGASRAVLQLPAPKGTVPLSVTGRVDDLTIRTRTGTPVQLRLGKGAATSTVDGATRTAVNPGAALVPAGWESARNRYDLTASATIGAIRVEHA
jgi:hypothetical protein